MAVVTGTVNINAQFNQTVSTGVTTPQSIPAGISLNYSFTNGTGTGMVDLCYGKQLTLSGTATTLDLRSLTDLAGTALVFARVRLIIIQNLATTAAHTVTVGAAAATQWSPGFFGTTTSTIILQPNVGATDNKSLLVGLDPYTIGTSTGAYVDATHKDLKLDPGANTISVNVLILGCSAAS